MRERARQRVCVRERDREDVVWLDVPVDVVLLQSSEFSLILHPNTSNPSMDAVETEKARVC